jgi:hypothetical protein
LRSPPGSRAPPSSRSIQRSFPISCASGSNVRSQRQHGALQPPALADSAEPDPAALWAGQGAGFTTIRMALRRLSRPRRLARYAGDGSRQEQTHGRRYSPLPSSPVDTAPAFHSATTTEAVNHCAT